MNRIAPITLAVALAGTGCIVDSHDDGGYYDDVADVIVYWDFLRYAPASPNADRNGFVLYDPYDIGTTLPNGMCAESGVEVVDVDTPAGTFSFDCVYDGVQGATLLDMPRGTYNYTITGWRGDVAVYRTTVAITNDVSGTQNGIDVDPVSAPIDLFAYLRYGTDLYYQTCNEAQNPTITYRVWDSAGTLVLDDAVACPGTAVADPLPVFIGDLDLDDYTVRMQGLNASSQVVLDSCAWQFDHFDTAGQTGDLGIPITLDTNPVPTCR